MSARMQPQALAATFRPPHSQPSAGNVASVRASVGVSVIIPTKDRPGELRETVASLLAQTVSPLEILIVDQSQGDGSWRAVSERWPSAATSVRLRYFREPAISGATAARNYAMDRAEGEIWLFLDDDVILEPDFIAALLCVYRDHPRTDGVSGVITNYRAPSWRFRLWRRIFERGLFRDDRQPIYWRADALRHSPPLPVTRFGSGLMSFRAARVAHHRFDPCLPGVPRGEDVDFCLRLGAGARLLIAPGARLAHKGGNVARIPAAWLTAEMRGARYLYGRHRHRHRAAALALAWLFTGYALLAVVECGRARSFVGLRAYIAGWRAPSHAGPAGRRLAS